MAEPTSGNEIVFDKSIDQLLEALPVGSMTKALGKNMYGINFRQTGNVLPRAKDSYGYTFFTRPQLNLTTINVSNYRGLYNLLTSVAASYQRYTRLMLDPRLSVVGGLKSPFVDPLSAFIPMLTNNIVSVSGWPDLTVPTYTSEAGLYGEEHSFVDGVTNHFESFDVDVTFKNIRGNPLLYFFYTWIKYQSLVFEGVFNPYIDMITENEIDYNTRIYRIVLDQTKRYVTYIGATGASFPLNVPTGTLFDYNTETPLNTKNSEISIRFKSMGFIAFEDYLKLAFNQTVAIFNADMRAVLKHDLGSGSDEAKARERGDTPYGVPGTGYVKIPHYLIANGDGVMTGAPYNELNHKAYPFINLLTNEFEWWTHANNFKSRT